MEGNKAGVGVVIIIAVVVALSFSYVLTTPTGSHKQVIPSNPAHTNSTALWADAAGWNFNHGPINPTLSYQVGTVVTFTVTEEDGAPHTLTINPGGSASNPVSGESRSGATTVLSIAQITQTKGHVSTGKFYFSKAGVYTYWCTVHPTTMVGLIYVNASASSSVSHATPHPSVSGTLNINPSFAYTSYLDMTTISGTPGGTLEL